MGILKNVIFAKKIISKILFFKKKKANQMKLMKSLGVEVPSDPAVGIHRTAYFFYNYLVLATLKL